MGRKKTPEELVKWLREGNTRSRPRKSANDFASIFPHAEDEAADTKHDRTADIRDSFLRENPWHPWHCSDRGDELLDALDEAQLVRLFDALSAKKWRTWIRWLIAHRAQIARYDGLPPRERDRLLRSSACDDFVVCLHWGCTVLEICHARIRREFWAWPPNGPPLSTPEEQREMLLALGAFWLDLRVDEAWPFDYPSDSFRTPFPDIADD